LWVTRGAALFLYWFLAGCSGPFSTLDPAGPAARSVAGLWWGMLAFATLVLVVLAGLWLYAMHRAPGSADANTDIDTDANSAPDTDANAAQMRRIHQRWIIGGGLVLPVASIVVLLTFGIPIGHRMLPLAPAEGEAVRIDVTGHQWWWQVQYPATGISLENELHIPVGVPVDIYLTSADVIHSFWVPRLGGKLDAIPGRINILRLVADRPGVYRGQCAEFCGLQHAHMQFRLHAHRPEDFAIWLQEAQRDD
jgi:cytochrome c oxidase subunit 2